MTSAMSCALTSRSDGEPLARKSDFRSIAGTPGGTSNSRPRKPFSTRTALAPLRLMMSAASAALKRVLTGTKTPPAVSRPNAAMIHSAQLGAQMATRSPLSMPIAANAPAAQRIRSTNCAKLSRTEPSTTASASPKRSAALKTISGMVAQLMPRSSHRHESRQVAAHDLGLIGHVQVLERVGEVTWLGQPFRMRVVRPEQHPVHSNQIDQVAHPVLVERADVDAVLDLLNRIAQEALRRLFVHVGQLIQQRRQPLRPVLDHRDLQLREPE